MSIEFIAGMALALDAGVVALMQAIQAGWLSALMQVLTSLGNPAFWFLIAAIYYWLGRENESAFLVIVVLASAAITALGKTIIARPRPEDLSTGSSFLEKLPETEYSKYSFPSGHSSMIAAALIYFRNAVGRNLNALLVLAVIIVSFSRLYLGKHYLTDVIAGLLLGAAIGLIVVELKEKYAGKKFNWNSRKALALNIIIGLLLLLLILGRDYTYILVFLGYFAGFLAFKRLKLRIEKPRTFRETIQRILAGSTALLLLVIIITPENPVIAAASLGLIGLWTSLIYPLIILNGRKWLYKALAKQA